MEQEFKFASIAEAQIYKVLENHGRKLYEPKDTFVYTLQCILNWLGNESYDENGLKYDSQLFQKRLALLDFYFAKPEFFPCLNFELKNEFLLQKLRRFSFLVSLCESEPGKFKYFYFKDAFDGFNHPFILSKIKFEHLENFAITDLTNKRSYKNYETMKKFVIERDSYQFHPISDPQNLWFREQILSKKPVQILTYGQVLHYFQESKLNLQLELQDGSISFSKDLLCFWSSTFSCLLVCDNDLCKSSMDIIILNFTKRTMITYLLFRLSDFMKIKMEEKVIQNLLGSDVLLGPQNFLEDIKELYFLCDYLDDKIAIYKLMKLFDRQVTQKYERQKFYDVLRI